MEVITVFDWLKQTYPSRPVVVIGSSYGGYLAVQLTKYRNFDGLILRAPAIYKPSEFYTIKKNEDRVATQKFRCDTHALSQHPLQTRASIFNGNVLLIVYENDEQVAKEMTDAYANYFDPEVYIAKNFPHSLDSVEKAKVESYHQKIVDWIVAEVPHAHQLKL